LVTPPLFSGAGDFRNGVAKVRYGSRWGLIGKTGDWVVRPQYTDITIGDGIAEVVQGGRSGLVTLSGKMIVVPRYEGPLITHFGEGPIPVRRRGRWMFLNRHGEEIHPAGGDWGKFPFGEALPFSEGLTPCNSGAKWGWLNEQGRFQIPPMFDGAGQFGAGVAPARRDGKWGLVDRNGLFVVKPEFADIRLLRCRLGAKKALTSSALTFSYDGYCFLPLNHGLAAVQTGGKWGIIDTRGKVLAAAQFDAIDDFSEGLAPVLQDGKYGYVDTTGKIQIAVQFDEATPFAQAVAMVRQGASFGIIDRHGRYTVPPNLDGYPWQLIFSEGLALVMRRGKLGYVNSDGRLVIEPRFDGAEHFSGGMARVNVGGMFRTGGEFFHGGKWGYIGTKGNWVWEPTE
jgi:hypothetical protein